MTTTAVHTRSSSRPGTVITAIVGGALAALVAVSSLLAGVGERPGAATSTEIRHGSADALDRWLTPPGETSAPSHEHGSADALERRRGR